MHGLRTVQNVHLGGTLSADQQGMLPGWHNTGRTLLEVAALASNDSDATLQIGIGGASPDDDAIMTPKAIGDSNVPKFFTVADFDGVLADALRSSSPRLDPQVNLTWKINFNGPGTNEVQTVTITRNPTGGTFTLTYSGQTTGAIAFDATAATVATALKALSNIGDSDVTVTGPAGGPWVVTFVGALGETNVAQMTGNGASLTGVYNEIQLVTITGAPTGGTFTLTWSGQTTSALAFNASAAQVQAALRLLSNINGANVNVTGDAGGPYTVEFVGTLAGGNRAEMTADGASLTGGTTPAVAVTTSQEGMAPVLTIATQTAGVTGTAAQNVDLFFTYLEGGRQTAVTDLNRLRPAP